MWWWPGWTDAWNARSRWSWWVAVGWGLCVAAALRWSVGSSPMPMKAWGLWGIVAISSLAQALQHRWRTAKAGKTDRSGGAEDLFLRARREYLKGDWYEARQLLERLVRRHPQHLPGRLLLATLLRRSGEAERAESELRTLEVLPDAQQWRLEIDREREQLVAKNSLPKEKKEPVPEAGEEAA